MKLTVFLAATLTVSVLSTPVIAGNGHNRAVVDYGDLDLTKEAGRTTFDKRIDRAVRKVCQPGWTRSVREVAATRACILEKRAELAVARDTIVARAKKLADRRNLALNQR